jgi:hypothetical protein
MYVINYMIALKVFYRVSFFFKISFLLYCVYMTLNPLECMLYMSLNPL